MLIVSVANPLGNLISENTDRDDPRRANDLNDSDDPKCRKSSTDNADPTRAKLRKDIALPI
jgi:hypothetical protein